MYNSGNISNNLILVPEQTKQILWNLQKEKTIARRPNKTSTAKGLVSCSDIYLETGFRQSSNLFQGSIMSINKIPFIILCLIWKLSLHSLNKVTIFSIIFIFVISKIFTRQTDFKYDSLQVTVQVDTDWWNWFYCYWYCTSVQKECTWTEHYTCINKCT